MQYVYDNSLVQYPSFSEMQICLSICQHRIDRHKPDLQEGDAE